MNNKVIAAAKAYALYEEARRILNTASQAHAQARETDLS